MLEPSLHRRRHTVVDVSCQVRLSSLKRSLACAKAKFVLQTWDTTSDFVC